MRTFAVFQVESLEVFNKFVEDNFAQNAKGIDGVRQLAEFRPTVVYMYDSHDSYEEFVFLDYFLFDHFGEKLSSIQDWRDPWVDAAGNVCVIADFGCSGVYTGITIRDLERAFL